MQTYSTSSARLRAQLGEQIDFFNALTRNSASCLRELSALNCQLPQQLIEDAFTAGHSMLACKDVLQLSSTLATQAVAPVRHWSDYQQRLLRILSGARAIAA